MENFSTLEDVRVDVKDDLIGDHFSPAYTPRLKRLGIRGSKVENIAIGALSGKRKVLLETSTL